MPIRGVSCVVWRAISKRKRIVRDACAKGRGRRLVTSRSRGLFMLPVLVLMRITRIVVHKRQLRTTMCANTRFYGIYSGAEVLRGLRSKMASRQHEESMEAAAAPRFSMVYQHPPMNAAPALQRIFGVTSS